MKQVFTQKCLRVFALMVLMLASSMVANAKYYLRGDYTSDGSGWSSGIEFIYRYDMRHMYDYIDLTVHEGFQFKIFCDDEVYGSSGRYFGCSDGNNTVNSVPWISGSLTNDLYDDGENIVFAVAGTYRIIYHTHNSTVQIINIPCPVEEVTGLVGGRVDVNDTEGWAGRPMDVDVTPDYGYYATSADVNIELTAAPGDFHAPHRAPAVGEIFHPDGDEMATHDAPANYTFTMPDYPYGVRVSATFRKLPTHRIGFATGDYYSLSQDQENPAAVPVGTSVTITATYPEDLKLLQLVSIPHVAITDNGNNTFTFTMPDSDVDFYAVIASDLQGVVFDSKNHWASYYGNYTMNVPSDVTAYLVDGVADNEVQIEQAPVIPANTGVLLYSDVAKDNITTTLTGVYANESFTSLLQGSTEEQAISEGYGLLNDTFVRSQAGTLPAHRCYLPASAVPAGAPRMLKINRPGEGGVVTGVETISTNDVVNVKYVNMSGMTSDKPFEGMNVKVVTRSDGTTETSKIIK